MNDDNKRILVLLIFSILIICCITTFVAINHQSKIDSQILSNNIHMLNTKKENVDPTFKEKYNNIKHKVGMFDYVDNYNSNLSSVNVSIKDWNNLAEYIKLKYYLYNAFIIIVNKNTLLYTASAISFMIENLNKPIVFTDGIDTASTLLLVSQTKIPEVMISYNGKLYRAVSGISTPISIEKSLKYNNQNLNIIYINNNLVIPIIKVFPGIDEKYMKSFINNDNIQGIILELWQEGIAPTNEGFLKSINILTSKGVVILTIFKCDKLDCKTDIRLLEAGCLNGYDMTIETAYAKLAFLLSNVQDRKLIGKLMEINFRGEIKIEY